MRSHDQSSGRALGSAWFWLILLASVAPAAVRAQEGQEAPVPPSRSTDPIELAAHQIRVWSHGPEQWVILTNTAAIQQGLEGLRAQEAVIRIVPAPDQGAEAYRIEVYAEGTVQTIGRADPPQRTLRATFLTLNKIRLNPHDSAALDRLDGPPQDLAILSRAFPTAGPAPRPSARVTGIAAPPPHAPQSSGPVVVPSTLSRVVREALRGPDRPRDPAVTRAQAAAEDPPVRPEEPPAEDTPPRVELPPIEAAPVVPNLEAPAIEPPAETLPLPLPGPDNKPAPPLRQERPPTPPAVAPIIPGTQRITRIHARSGGPDFQVQALPRTKEGVSIFVVRGGVNLVTESPQYGMIDLEADSAIIWRYSTPQIGPNNENIDSIHSPMEVYLEGNVVIRQDAHTRAGTADQKTYRSKQAFYDFRTDRLISLDSELDLFAPGLISPAKVNSPRIEQYRPLVYGPAGNMIYGQQQIRADKTIMTGSRFPNPGYRITNRSIDLTKRVVPLTDPNSGKQVGKPGAPGAAEEEVWLYDARQNFFFLGPVPIFYWPRFVGEADDFEPVLRQISFRTNNYFGQQILTDWSGFKLFGIQKPRYVDNWNLDLDYLSERTKEFPALGSELGWFGKDLFNDLASPYRPSADAPSITRDYFGFFDIWGLRDSGRDTLGGGPAIITNNIAAGTAGFQRGGGGPKGAVPPFQDFRGRYNFRHMQYFLPEDDEHKHEELRLQLEIGTYSDRYFLEEYYKRLFETGLDQETLAYLIRQKDNWAWTLWTEANLRSWDTETQWLPKLDYYRIGDSLLGNRLTYYTHSGVDYANTHTASEVNNPHIFAFMPFDPISNTSGVFQSGRASTSHELDLPLQFDFLRVMPYVQGQAVAWNNQIAGNSVGRVWGAAGVRADVMAWRKFPGVSSELFNIHGLNHKINFEVDYRDAYSNVKLNQLGIQDDLDDNTYESVRRYFALTNYVGGVLPNQYDPRHLILRRTLSPITGTTDIQASIQTVQLGLHQRLQTKRGPEGRRRIVDYMTLDLSSTYFPDASRDNFGKPFGQNMYNWQWFVGDRTSLVSYGWFEFFDIKGLPIFKVNPGHHNNPFGLNVVTSGISIARPPRGNVFFGYTVLDTGPINTSALIVTTNYWLSPKWYGTYSTMYDFGNGILLASSFSLTRVGADWLTSLGLVVDPQRQSYMAAIQISPRLAPNVRLGSAAGLTQFDSRFAPTE